MRKYVCKCHLEWMLPSNKRLLGVNFKDLQHSLSTTKNDVQVYSLFYVQHKKTVIDITNICHLLWCGWMGGWECVYVRKINSILCSGSGTYLSFQLSNMRFQKVNPSLTVVLYLWLLHQLLIQISERTKAHSFHPEKAGVWLEHLQAHLSDSSSDVKETFSFRSFCV